LSFRFFPRLSAASFFRQAATAHRYRMRSLSQATRASSDSTRHQRSSPSAGNAHGRLGISPLLLRRSRPHRRCRTCRSRRPGAGGAPSRRGASCGSKDHRIDRIARGIVQVPVHV
jgi:hypothetical protein